MSDLYIPLIILSSIFTIASAIPYLIDIVRGKTKPKVVTWLVWSSVTAISGAASFVDGQYPAAILLLFATLQALSIVIFGWTRGVKKLERLDIVCLVGALVGIVLWQLFDSPAIAVIATIIIDLVGGVPTFVHSWKKPREETWITFMLMAMGGICTLIVVTDWRVTAFAYPLYLVLLNLSYVTIILGRRSVKRVRSRKR
jgi:hypothetical protein